MEDLGRVEYIHGSLMITSFDMHYHRAKPDKACRRAFAEPFSPAISITARFV